MYLPRPLRLALPALLSLGLAAPTTAADAPVEPSDRPAPTPAEAAAPRPPEPMALTVSGGVSLGAWEAGFLHYAVGVIRENPGHTQLRLATGASAGAANSLMAVVAEYGAPEPTPRRFDFALGMYEADRMFVAREARLAAELGEPVRITRPHDRHPSPSWRPFECLRAGLGERPGAASACAGADLRELRILMQASLFRLWDTCTLEDGEASASTDHPQCLRARDGQPPPLVPGVEGAGQVAWRRAEGEAELEHVTRLLAELRFRWRDLGLGPGEGDHALGELRRVAGRVVDALTAAQPVEDRLLLGTLGSAAANALAYAPPRHRLWVALGRELEVALSHGILEERRRLPVRPHVAAQLVGALTALSSDRLGFGVGLLAGLELQPVQLASHHLQPSLVLRGGVLLSPEDGWGARACPAPASTDPAACTRPSAQALLALTVLERVRLHLLGEWYPSRAGRRPWAIAPAVGLQLNY